MKASEFFANLAEGFTAKCERCGENAHILTTWVDWEDRVFTCLYQCIRCGNTDWFAYNAPNETEVKPKGMDNGYL